MVTKFFLYYVYFAKGKDMFLGDYAERKHGL